MIKELPRDFEGTFERKYTSAWFPYWMPSYAELKDGRLSIYDAEGADTERVLVATVQLNEDFKVAILSTHPLDLSTELQLWSMDLDPATSDFQFTWRVQDEAVAAQWVERLERSCERKAEVVVEVA